MVAAVELTCEATVASSASEEPSAGLEVTLRAAIDALTRLDPDCLESLARACERMTPASATTEARSALSSHRILGCLLEHTRRNLELLTRITERSNEEYGHYQRPSF
jgi:hypothetical protein